MRAGVITLSVVGMIAASADATLFSFRSDDDDMSWTFKGFGSQIVDAADQVDPFFLAIDDDNGPLPAITLPVEFLADFSIEHVSSVPLPSGDMLHVYQSGGGFSFNDPSTGAALLEVSFDFGVVSALGGQSTWYSTNSVQVSDGGNAMVTYVATPALIDLLGPGVAASYGIFAGASIGPDDFGFDLTVLNHSGAIPYVPGFEGVALGEEFLPSQQWWSEASFSGSAHFTPAPGAVAILAIGLPIASRRRR